jgi:hypothetical protein
MVEEEGQRFPAVLEAFEMGDETASLHRKGEVLWGPFIPGLEDLFPGKTIKGNIELHRPEMGGIELEPFSLGKVRRIENPIPPVGIVVAACADVKH